jgi:MFS family permease
VVLAPHLSPFVFGFLVARTTWRWAYGIGTLYNLVVFALIVLFMKESYATAFFMLSFRSIDDVYLQDYIFDVKDKCLPVANKLDYGIASRH